MSPFIILTIILFLYLFSKPKWRFYIERDGFVLSREWTSFVNAMFITLVVCSHGLGLFRTTICDYQLEQGTAEAVRALGQLIVTVFFFYSGYGIMLSLTRRAGYERMLIYPRFFSLGLNFFLAVLVYFVVHCLLRGEVVWSDLLGGLHEYKYLGNPTWFILMTLLTYVLTYICHRLFSKMGATVFVLALTVLLLAVIYGIGELKPRLWGNTLLCFPAGMFYFLYGEKLEALIRQTCVPSIVYALILLFLGKRYFGYNIYVENMAGILFAVGVTWFVGSFSWGRPSRFLIWLGGSGLFAVYMFHTLPMRVFSTLGLNMGQPYVVWLQVVVSSAFLVGLASVGYGYLNKVLFQRNKI